MYSIEESTCDICMTFRRTPSDLPPWALFPLSSSLRPCVQPWKKQLNQDWVSLTSRKEGFSWNLNIFNLGKAKDKPSFLNTVFKNMFSAKRKRSVNVLNPQWQHRVKLSLAPIHCRAWCWTGCDRDSNPTYRHWEILVLYRPIFSQVVVPISLFPCFNWILLTTEVNYKRST